MSMIRYSNQIWKKRQIMNNNWFCSKCTDFDMLKKTNDRECSLCHNTLAN
jgi:hypothetical protein